MIPTLARFVMVSVLSISVVSADDRSPGPTFVDHRRGISKQREAADAAAEVARAASDPAAVITLLGDDSAWVRDRVVKEVVASWSDEQLATLAVGLRNPAPLIVEGVAEIYAKKKFAPSAKALAGLLKKRQPEATVGVVLHALGEIGGDVARKGVEGLLRKQKKNGRLRAAALRALHAIDPSCASSAVEKGLDSKHAAERVAAIDLLRAEPAKWLARAAEWIGGTDDRASVSRPLFAVLDGLVTLDPDVGDREAWVKVVDALLGCIEGTSGRPRADLFRTLRQLTGEAFPDDDQLWESWWKANADRWQRSTTARKGAGGKADESEKKGKTKVVRIHGMAVDSSRVLFLQDLSGGMSRNAAGEYDGAGDSRLDRAKRELAQALGKLADTAYVQLAYFASYFHTGPGGDRPLAKSRRKLVAFNERQAVPKKPHHNRGNLYDSLVWAIDRPHVDTVYLLTEGAPTEGKYLDYDRFLEHFGRSWRDTRTRVHVIYLGSPKGRNRSFMEQLAKSTGGEFHTVDLFRP